MTFDANNPSHTNLYGQMFGAPDRRRNNMRLQQAIMALNMQSTDGTQAAASFLKSINWPLDRSLSLLTGKLHPSCDLTAHAACESASAVAYTNAKLSR